MALDGVTSFFTLERRYKYMYTYATQSNYWREFFSAMAKSWKKLKTLNVLSSFIVCQNRNRSALVRQLLANNSLFVGMLYEDKSLALRARDLIFFTADLQTVNCTKARVFVLRIRVSCAFPTRCTCVEFQLRMKRESTYFETLKYSFIDL